MKGLFYAVLSIALSASMAQGADPVEVQVAKWKARARRNGWTFKVGMNPTLRMPESQRSCYNPSLKDKDAKWVKPKHVRDLPSHWDWREQGIVSDVKDQHSPQWCGSCWAHGTVAVFESLIKMKTGRDVMISEQQLVSCRPSYGTCNGGNFAFGYYLKHGANYMEDFPYVAADIDCDYEADQHEMLSSWGYVGQQNRRPTTEEIKDALYQYGPVAATVSASGAWDYYKSGVYDACHLGSINHIVAIVGWDDDEQSWIVKNSHGTEWGDGGYIRIKWTDEDGNKCNHIGDEVAFATFEPNKHR